MKYYLLTACIIQLQLLQASEEVYYKKFVRSTSGNCQIIEDTTVPQYSGLKDKNHVEIFKKAAISPVYDSNLKFPNSDEIIETYSMSSVASQRNLNDLCSKTSVVEALESGIDEQTYEVRKIIDSGDPKNRIDVVIMGDGYTANEREKFFDDLARLIRDMFEGVTFKSWLPLFNIWGIHVNSVDSGIGYDGPKNTPFKLYREKGQLRGILPGDPKNARAKCKLTGANACDYPSILANDDFYGGLGGEFVISTRSERTGTVVLRHEMGHNFVYVGEEYDNGWVYSGVNASPSLKKLKWEKWLSGPLREEREMFRLLEYPWHDLSKGPKSFNFTSDGKYSRWYLLTSVSAAGQADSLEFILDGKALPWETRGSDDREFYDWRGTSGLSAGQHTFTVRSKTASTNKQIPRMIASVTLHEYGNEDEFNISNDYISAYPTWDVYHNKTYRPTSEGCLMRNMTSQSFCKVCKEGLWRQFLKRISLIDDVEVKNGKATVSPIKLGQLRPTDKQIPGEKLRIRWYKSGKLISKFNDKLTIRVSPGKWKVKVKLISPEVRSDPKRFLTSTKSFKVKHRLSHIWIKIKSYIYPF